MNHHLPAVLTICLLATAACRPAAPPVRTSSAADHAALDLLLQRMHARLDRMHTVAQVKWNAQAPITDAERERALLEDVVERGKAHRLDPVLTRTFFAAQVEAAKVVQEDDFRRWRAANQPRFAEVPDLPSLRREIDVLNGEILAALAGVWPFLEGTEGQGALNDARGRHGVPAEAWEMALRPLRQR